MNNTESRKFSDLIADNKKLELHVGACIEAPAHFNIYDPNRVDFFSVALLTEGEVNIKLNLKERTVNKNSLIFLPPNTLSQLIRRTDTVQLYTIVFTAKFLTGIGMEKHEIEMIDFSSRTHGNILVLEESEMSTLKKITEDLQKKNDQIDGHPYGESIVQYTFRIFLSEMAALGVKYNGATKSKSSRKHDLVAQFANMVNLHFKEHRTVKYYADLLSITPKYLTEIIHEITGQSASTFIDEKVMYEAKLLLHNPKLTISQIAETLHFSDQSFLGKFFKRHLGLSPSEYRSHY